MKHKTNETHLWHLSKRFFIFSLIEAAFSALKQFSRDSQVNRPNLPFVEICQSFKLNLFIHGNKVSIGNLSMTKHQKSNENFDSEKTLLALAGLDSTSPTSTGRPWWLISRLSSFLFSVDTIAKRILTWGCPCTCAPEPRWTGAKGWKSARRRSS